VCRERKAKAEEKARGLKEEKEAEQAEKRKKQGTLKQEEDRRWTAAIEDMPKQAEDSKEIRTGMIKCMGLLA